jgi:uncharacterized protein YjlB
MMVARRIGVPTDPEVPVSTNATIEPTDIVTEEAALAAIAEIGWHGFVRDVTGQVEDFHWHEFDVVAYVMNGEAAAEYDDGRTLRGGAGTLARLPAGTVHKDIPGTSYRAVFGFDIHPNDFTQPINKPVSELPAAT